MGCRSNPEFRALSLDCCASLAMTAPSDRDPLQADFPSRANDNRAGRRRQLRPFRSKPLPVGVSWSPWVERGVVGGQLLAVAIDPDRRGGCRLPYRRPAVGVVVPLPGGWQG